MLTKNFFNFVQKYQAVCDNIGRKENACLREDTYMKMRAIAALPALLLALGLSACTPARTEYTSAGAISPTWTEYGSLGGTEDGLMEVEDVSLLGTVNRFAGKVVAGQSEEIKRDAGKEIGEIYVAEGDFVTAGTVLFSYDVQALEFDLEKLELELADYENSISAAEDEIEELETERDKATSDQQLSYTLQIQSLSADIREAEYNKTLKQHEIEVMEAALENTEVCCTIDGRVMSVADTETQGEGDATGAFITVTDVESYRVEGYVNELNAGELYEGLAVWICSRTDESVKIRGTVESIDWENPVKSNSGDYYYMENDDMTTSSKYPFYVVPDTRENLLLGQHVYLEPIVEG